MTYIFNIGEPTESGVGAKFNLPKEAYDAEAWAKHWIREGFDIYGRRKNMHPELAQIATNEDEVPTMISYLCES